MKLCFTSDLHGDKQLYTQLVDLIHRERPDILLLGGDQCHTVTGDSAIEEQQVWLLTEFRRFLEEIRPICCIFWTSGNHDLAGNLPAVTELQCQNLITNCDLQPVDLGEDISLLGFPFGPVNGWPYRDWERLDTDQSLPLKQYPQSFLTVNGRMDQVRTDDYFRSLPRLADLLDESLRQVQGNHILLLSHYPPYGINLDISSYGHQIGCRKLREVLPSSDITMVCSGHVHEAPYLTGCWFKTIGPTLCVNPGQWGEKLHALLIRTEDIQESLVHTVFGNYENSYIPRYSAEEMRRVLEQRWKSDRTTPLNQKKKLLSWIGSLLR